MVAIGSAPTPWYDARMVDAGGTSGVRAGLKQIVNDYAARGTDLSADPRLAEAVLLDSFPESPAEIRALVEAIRSGAIQHMRDRAGQGAEFSIEGSASQLAESAGLRADLARWAAESWWSALSLGPEPGREATLTDVAQSAGPAASAAGVPPAPTPMTATAAPGWAAAPPSPTAPPTATPDWTAQPPPLAPPTAAPAWTAQPTPAGPPPTVAPAWSAQPAQTGPPPAATPSWTANPPPMSPAGSQYAPTGGPQAPAWSQSPAQQSAPTEFGTPADPRSYVPPPYIPQQGPPAQPPAGNRNKIVAAAVAAVVVVYLIAAATGHFAPFTKAAVVTTTTAPQNSTTTGTTPPSTIPSSTGPSAVEAQLLSVIPNSSTCIALTPTQIASFSPGAEAVEVCTPVAGDPEVEYAKFASNALAQTEYEAILDDIASGGLPTGNCSEENNVENAYEATASSSTAIGRLACYITQQKQYLLWWHFSDSIVSSTDSATLTRQQLDNDWSGFGPS